MGFIRIENTLLLVWICDFYSRMWSSRAIVEKVMNFDDGKCAYWICIYINIYTIFMINIILANIIIVVVITIVIVMIYTFDRTMTMRNIANRYRHLDFHSRTEKTHTHASFIDQRAMLIPVTYRGMLVDQWSWIIILSFSIHIYILWLFI